MDCLQQLGRVLARAAARVAPVLLVVLLAMSTAAYAAIPGNPNGAYYQVNGNPNTISFVSYQDACTQFAQENYAYLPNAYGVHQSSNNFCFIYQANGTYVTGVGMFTASTFVCPANSTRVGTTNTCSCTSPFVENAAKTACVSAQQNICTGAKGVAVWSTFNGTMPSVGSSACQSIGCTGVFQGGVSYKNTVTGIQTNEGEFVLTDQVCAYNSGAPDAVAPDSCKGGFAGQIDGVTTCVPYSGDTNVISATKSTSTQSTSTSVQNGTTTQSITGSNGTESVTCLGAACTKTTTTTTTKPDGTTETKTDQVQQNKVDYCKENPTSAQCKADTATSFTGSCAAGYSCSGDAVMCAAAKAAHEQKCLLTPSTDVQGVVNQITNGTWAMASDLPKSVKDVGSFNQTNPFSSSCPANQTVVISGQSFVIPLADACTELQMMGNVLVAFSLLGATMFVLKGLGGGA